MLTICNVPIYAVHPFPYPGVSLAKPLHMEYCKAASSYDELLMLQKSDSYIHIAKKSLLNPTTDDAPMLSFLPQNLKLLPENRKF